MNETSERYREEFSAREAMRPVQETASVALAAQSKAMTEARYIIALRNPRDWDQVRQNILRECERPSFANNKSVYYIKPIGNGVEGLGIRFVEAALRHMGNTLIESMMTYEDDDKEIHRVTVSDLQCNTTFWTDVIVTKTVERSKPLDDGSFISVRKNSYGKFAYTVPATDDDLPNKRGALISKAIRSQGERLIPGDIKDEAIEIIKEIRLKEIKKDPDAERKRIADSFIKIGVKVSDLQDYLGHKLDTCSPAELVELRGIFSAIREGEATWKSVMDNAQEKSAEGDKKSGNGNGNGNGEAEKKLPTCSPESFAKKKASWKAVIESGKKSVNDLIAMIQTKETLSDEQKIEIASWVSTTVHGEVIQQGEKQ